MLTVNAHYLPNGKAYELQTWRCSLSLSPTERASVSAIRTEYEESHQQQAPLPPRSKVKAQVYMTRLTALRCWPISRERNVL